MQGPGELIKLTRSEPRSRTGGHLPEGLDRGVEKSRQARLPRNKLLQAQLKKRSEHLRGGEELQDGRVHGKGAEACCDFGQHVDLVRHLSPADLQIFCFDVLTMFRGARESRVGRQVIVIHQRPG